MKKVFLSIGCVAILGMGAIFVSCKDDEKSDKEKGKDDGKAYCECANKTELDSKCEALMEKFDNMSEGNVSQDYALGFAEEAMKCLGDISFE